MTRFVLIFIGALALIDCGGEASCEWGGESWAAGECGKTTCTKLVIAARPYWEQAKRCDPKASRQCTEYVWGSWVNAENTAAVDLVRAGLRRFNAMSCDADVKPDGYTPEWAVCSAEGQCVDEYEHNAGCRVNGQTYVSGTRDIPGLFGCGSCVCEYGALTCTGNEACEGACPSDSAPGTQCDGCFHGRCPVTELACLKLCETTCDVGTCVDGMCRTLCD